MGKGEQKAGKGGETKYPVGVKFFKFWHKTSLRSWADPNGVLLLTENKEPARYYKLDAVAKLLTRENSEAVARPPFGLSLLAANMEAGAAVLANMPNCEDSGYKVTGIPAAKRIVDNDFVDALRILNTANKASAEDATQQAAAHILDILGDGEKAEAQTKTFARLADASSRLYALAMGGLELSALSSNPQAWAKKVSDVEKQEKGVQRFVKRKTLEALATATAASHTRRQAKSAGGGKRAYGQEAASEESGASSVSESVASSESTSAKPAKKKAAKPAEKRKKKDKKNKKMTKKKKDKKGKKKEKKSPSSSGSAASLSSQSQKAKQMSAQKKEKDKAMREKHQALEDEDEAKEAGYAAWSLEAAQEMLSLADSRFQAQPPRSCTSDWLALPRTRKDSFFAKHRRRPEVWPTRSEGRESDLGAAG